MWNLYYEEEENLSAEILEVNIPRSAFYSTSLSPAQNKIGNTIFHRLFSLSPCLTFKILLLW